MTAKMRMTLALLGIALLAGVAWWVQAGDVTPTDRIEVAGKIRSQSRTVVAPAIAYPVPDYTIGIPTPPPGTAGSGGTSAPGASGAGSAAQAKSAAKAAVARTGMPVVSGLLTTVTVSQGDRVEAGQVVAQLDRRLLDLGVEQAQTAARRARADVALMGDNLNTIADNQAKIADARVTLSSGKARLTDTRAQLVSTRSDLRSARKKALAGRSAIKAQIAQLQSIPTTPTPQQAQMLVVLKGKLAEVNAGIRKIDVGLAKISAGLAKVDAALAQLPSASAQISTASSALSDAKTQVTSARKTLGVVADAKDIAISQAKAARSAANITAPEAGVITSARSAGTVAMVGAPVVRIQPDGPQLIDTYLTGEQLARVVVGKGVQVTCDSLPGKSFSARISRIGAVSEFPPSSFPTRIVHMTRTVRVTATLDAGATLPAGTPVDLTIFTDLP